MSYLYDNFGVNARGIVNLYVNSAVGRNCSYCFVGSSYIEDKVVNDIDILVYVDTLHETVSELFNRVNQHVQSESWEFSGSMLEYHHDGKYTFEWGSYKKEIDGVIYNLIIVFDLKYYLKFSVAARYCKALHVEGIVLSKQQRINIHEIIRDNKSYTLLKKENTIVEADDLEEIKNESAILYPGFI
jgi:hypothetical protein